MTFSLEEPRRPRRPSLTPMIDVVFLLLVFFMLASRFGLDMHVPLRLSSGEGEAYSGPPRLVDIRPETLSLNGIAMDPEALIAELGEMTESEADTIVLRARDGATLQHVVSAMEELSGAGFTSLTLVGTGEAPADEGRADEAAPVERGDGPEGARP
ncbi:biopolymer transporter ExbD [Tropicimonas sp. IMCC34011]|uniref:ExbD/TolR family protein n=1 Tax=Tropicimonas sp. IMCC34011 TaxID=2248759 RepID=UPI000E25AD99